MLCINMGNWGIQENIIVSLSDLCRWICVSMTAAIPLRSSLQYLSIHSIIAHVIVCVCIDIER